MKKTFIVKLLIILLNVFLCLGFVSCNQEEETEQITPTQLGEVQLTIEDNVVTWEKVPNALRYAYQINEEDVVETTLREVILEDGDKIKVKAMGDGKYYIDSAYCQHVTYVAPKPPTPLKLGTVTVTLEENVATWNSVVNATAYAYQIDDGEEIKTTAKAILLQDGETIKVKALGDGVNYTDGDYSNAVKYTYSAPILPEKPNYNTIVVEKTINEGESVTLADVTLPTEYTWKNPTTILTESGFYDAYYKETIDAKVYVDLTVIPADKPVAPTPVALGTVTLRLYDNVAMWGAVSNASRYAYQINNGEVIETTAKAIVLRDGESIRVKAIGDGVNYTDGEWTNVITYNAPVNPETPNYNTIVVEKTIDEGENITLADVTLPTEYIWKTPTMVLTESGFFDAYYKETIEARVYVDLKIKLAPVPEKPNPIKLGSITVVMNENKATWSVVTNAARYAYQIDNGVIVETTLREVLLQNGESIKVKALGDGENYIDGDWSNTVSYTAPEKPAPVKLTTPVVTLSGHTASWEEVDRAHRYAYVINEKEVVETTLTSVLLTAGDTIKVKAIGDGETCIDSNYCETVTHDTIYDAPINDGPVVLTLNTLDTLTSASATTDGNYSAFSDTVLKAYGEASFGIQYLQNASITIPLYRNGAPMTQEKLAIYDEIRVWALVPIDSTYANIVPTISVGSQKFTPSTLKDGWNALRLNVNTLIAEGFISSITVQVSQATKAPWVESAQAYSPYVMRVDNVEGVFNEKLDIGSVMIFGDSYSTFEGYLHDPRFYYYANKAVAQTDLTKVEQTWWGQVLSNTNSNLYMNNSVSGSTICGTTYGTTSAPQDSFVERIDALIADGYFERNTIDTFFIFGGTNDSWGCSPLGTAKYSGWTAEDKNQVLPSICYMISKIMEVQPNAQIIVMLNTYENLNDSLIPSWKPTPIDYQSPIMNAVKGFAEYGSKIHIVALNDHENNNINLMGLHPTVTGAAAIKDQLLNILYERKYLAKEQWTEFGTPYAPAPTQKVVQNFAEDIGYHHNVTVTITTDSTYTKDGNGAWKVTESNYTIGSAYLIGQLCANLDAYSELKFSIYADQAAAGTKIYLDHFSPLSNGTYLGTVQEGWNEFTIAANRVTINHNDGSNKHIRIAFHMQNANGVLYFDSIIGVCK